MTILNASSRFRTLSSAARQLFGRDRQAGAGTLAPPVVPDPAISEALAEANREVLAAARAPTPSASASNAGPRFRLATAASGVPRTLGVPPAPTERAPSASAPRAGSANSSADVRAAERARVATVSNSEHSLGRERQALAMLATSASADEITGLLAKSPKDAGSVDPMLAALGATPNPDLGASLSSDEGRSAGASWDRIWDEARATNSRPR